MTHPDPVALPGLVLFTVGGVAFILSTLAARRRNPPEQAGRSRRSRVSVAGILIQGVGIGIAGVGNIVPTLDPFAPKALIEVVAVTILIGGTVWLFRASTAAMGRNWSLVARTRDDHRLVTDGPFAWVRHPIYVAMALFLLALAVAFGHLANLAIALPVFALGTAIRVREEERLLRAHFGEEYDRYSMRVKRFVPGLV